MSVIQTIRNKYGKIAGAVIAVALVGFIVSDARNGSFGNFFSSNDNNVMEVDGVKISPKEYQERLKEYETLYVMFNKGRVLDEAARAQMNEQVVQMIVYETLVSEECDKLGIQTSEDEKKELVYGQNAHPLIKQFQINGQQVFISQQTNQFDATIIKQLEKELNDQPQRIDPTGKLREQWENVKSYVVRNSRVDKYNTLFSGSVYIPMYLAKRMAADQTSVASIRFVKIPFTSVPDNDVKVSDDDIKDYMKKHAALYETDQPTRAIEYVSFDIVPAVADTARVLESLAQIKDDFATTKDNKTFVNSKSDEANSYSEAYLNKRTFMSRDADTIMSQPIGTIYGPYYEDGFYKLSKIVDVKTLPDSAKIRHILVKTKDRGNDVMSDTAAKMKLDSAIAIIRAGGKFDSVVARYSDDDGSKGTGGEYTFTLIQRPGIAKEFGDFAFEGQKGETKTVKVSNDNYAGYHFIEVLEHNGVGRSVQLATVAKSLVPSDSTNNAIYGKANEFAGKNQTAADFDATIKKQNFDKRIGDNVKPGSFSISGLGSAREIVKWMYEHKVGDVSQVFQLGDQRYVVAKLSSIQEKGVMGITAANRPMLEQKVREEKKAELIIKNCAGAGSLDAIAQKTNQQVQQADTVTFNGGFVTGLGYEPKVVGYTFSPALQPNTLSAGIKGQGGVYFITVLNRAGGGPVDPGMMQMMGQQRYMQENQMRNAVGQMLQQTVTKKGDVTYNVGNF